MSTLKHCLTATAGLALFVTALTLLSPSAGQSVPPAKDVNIVNDANNPVPVTVQNGANDDGEPFEFSGSAVNTTGSIPTCIVPQAAFTVPTGEQFTVTDVVVSKLEQSVFEITVEFARNQTRIFSINLRTNGTSAFSHTFRTGLTFEEEEILNVSVTNVCDNFSAAIFLVTGISTTS